MRALYHQCLWGSKLLLRMFSWPHRVPYKMCPFAKPVFFFFCLEKSSSKLNLPLEIPWDVPSSQISLISFGITSHGKIAFNLFSSMRFNCSKWLWTYSASFDSTSINTLKEGILTLMGKSVCILYTKENGVALVKVQTEVLYPCKANATSHVNLCMSPQSSRLSSWGCCLPPQLPHSSLGSMDKNYNVGFWNQHVILSSSCCSGWWHYQLSACLARHNDKSTPFW